MYRKFWLSRRKKIRKNYLVYTNKSIVVINEFLIFGWCHSPTYWSVHSIERITRQNVFLVKTERHTNTNADQTNESQSTMQLKSLVMWSNFGTFRKWFGVFLKFDSTAADVYLKFTLVKKKYKLLDVEGILLIRLHVLSVCTVFGIFYFLSSMVE